ncbi:hypothetical protein HDK90DRAFT_471034 [Phyllosticta capitalensis]|uniref:Uncharacterized protein n=1 Tax=Phyllosticta capitalensis TaxID=121624 RepID=A0ABR1Y9F4_9PEZI
MACSFWSVHIPAGPPPVALFTFCNSIHHRTPTSPIIQSVLNHINLLDIASTAFIIRLLKMANPRRRIPQQHPDEGKVDIMRMVDPQPMAPPPLPARLTTGGTADMTNPSPGNQLFGNSQARATNVVLAGLEPSTRSAAPLVNHRGWEIVETTTLATRVTSFGTIVQTRVKDFHVQEKAANGQHVSSVPETRGRTTQMNGNANINHEDLSHASQQEDFPVTRYSEIRSAQSRLLKRTDAAAAALPLQPHTTHDARPLSACGKSLLPPRNAPRQSQLHVNGKLEGSHQCPSHATAPVRRPTGALPTAKQPIPHKPLVTKPVIGKPALHKPLTSKPGTSKQDLPKQVIAKPVITKPVIEKPVIEKPVITKPVVPMPAIAKPAIAKRTSNHQKMTEASVNTTRVASSGTVVGVKDLSVKRESDGCRASMAKSDTSSMGSTIRQASVAKIQRRSSLPARLLAAFQSGTRLSSAVTPFLACSPDTARPKETDSGLLTDWNARKEGVPAASF